MIYYNPMIYNIGDKVRLKKTHPCGSHEWEIIRVGMDFKIKCEGCGHLVMLSRAKFEKSVKAVISSVEEPVDKRV
jgi:hypothetical protein